MLVVGVVDIRQAPESLGKAFANGDLPLEAGTPPVGPTRSFEHTVRREEPHDAIKVMSVDVSTRSFSRMRVSAVMRPSSPLLCTAVRAT